MSDSLSSARYRNFATVVYPDSASLDWKDIIINEHVPVFISPLHDRDVDPLNQPKKPHYHVMVMYDGKKSHAQVRDFFDRFGGVGLEVVQSIRGYARYLCHLDNPEKAQYSQDDVVCYAGADYVGVIGLAIDKMRALSEMQDFCDEYDVKNFYLLSSYARVHRSDWHRVLCESGTYFMREYLKGRKYAQQDGYMHIFDKKTGNIIF